MPCFENENLAHQVPLTLPSLFRPLCGVDSTGKPLVITETSTITIDIDIKAIFYSTLVLISHYTYMFPLVHSKRIFTTWLWPVFNPNSYIFNLQAQR